MKISTKRKANQIEILQLKNTMNEKRNTIETPTLLYQAEERICELKDKSFEMIQSEKKKVKKTEENL